MLILTGREYSRPVLYFRNMSEYYSAFDKLEEIELINLLLEWLGEIGYSTVCHNSHGLLVDICWGGCDTEARLAVDDEEIILYTKFDHLSLRAGIYSEEDFGRIKRFLERYAKFFEQGGNGSGYKI